MSSSSRQSGCQSKHLLILYDLYTLILPFKSTEIKKNKWVNKQKQKQKQKQTKIKQQKKIEKKRKGKKKVVPLPFCLIQNENRKEIKQNKKTKQNKTKQNKTKQNKTNKKKKKKNYMKRKKSVS